MSDEVSRNIGYLVDEFHDNFIPEINDTIDVQMKKKEHVVVDMDQVRSIELF